MFFCLLPFDFRYLAGSWVILPLTITASTNLLSKTPSFSDLSSQNVKNIRSLVYLVIWTATIRPSVSFRESHSCVWLVLTAKDCAMVRRVRVRVSRNVLIIIYCFTTNNKSLQLNNYRMSTKTHLEIHYIVKYYQFTFFKRTKSLLFYCFNKIGATTLFTQLDNIHAGSVVRKV